MPRLILSFALVMLAAIGLSACAGKNRIQTSADRVYDVRKAVVTADAGGALHGDGRRPAPRRHGDPMTRRPVDMPRVVMNIHLSSVRKGMGLDKGQSEAEVQVTLADAHEGQPFLANTMKVTATPRRRPRPTRRSPRPLPPASASPMR